MTKHDPNPASASSKPKPVIGLLGGPGSGKSTVARHFAELNCAVIDADRLAHEALGTTAVKEEVRQRWGDSVFEADGSVSRPALGRIVFADPSALSQLEAILHPRVHQARQQKRETHQQDDNIVAIIEDCPLLLESGLDNDCDALVFVDTPEELRLARVKATRGWDAVELKKRDERQRSLDTKRQAADYIISNDQDLAYLHERVRNVLKSITHPTPP